MRFLYLLLCVVGLVGKSFASYEENKTMFVPGEFYDCRISPDGKYLALYRSVAGRNEEDDFVHVKRVYFQDLSSGEMTLAGRPDKKGTKSNGENEVVLGHWSEEGDFILRTKKEILAIDPSYGKVRESYRMHHLLEGLSEIESTDEASAERVFYEYDWARGLSPAFFTYDPKEKKIRKLNEQTTVKDLVVNLTELPDARAISVQSAMKSDGEWLLWRVSVEGELEKFTLDLDMKWRIPSLASGLLRDSEMLVTRLMESPGHFAEARLFDFESNEFVGATATFSKRDFDGFISILNSDMVDRLRSSVETVPFAALSDGRIYKLVEQLRVSYPRARVTPLNSTADGNVVVFSLSSANRPLVFLSYDFNTGQLRKLFEGKSEWSERKLSEAQLVEYESREEFEGNGLALFTPKSDLVERKSTLVLITDGAGWNWRFDPYTRYLSEEGYDVLNVEVPASFRLDLYRSSSPEALQEVQERFKEYLDTIFEAARDKGCRLCDEKQRVDYVLFGGVASFYGGLPSVEGLQRGKVFIVNPRFFADLKDLDLARVNSYERHSNTRFVRSSAWSDFMKGRDLGAKFPVVLISRDQDWSRWGADDSKEEQINTFIRYCEGSGIPCSVDVWQEGYWRLLASWQWKAELYVTFQNHIEGTEVKAFERIGF